LRLSIDPVLVGRDLPVDERQTRVIWSRSACSLTPLISVASAIERLS
jgi:hypothetical protein